MWFNILAEDYEYYSDDDNDDDDDDETRTTLNRINEEINNMNTLLVESSFPAVDTVKKLSMKNKKGEMEN